MAHVLSAEGQTVAGLISSQRIEESFQSVELELVDGVQHPAQLPLRKPLTSKPDQVAFRQVDNLTSLIFAERHAG